ncbi:hypothetical protein E9229_002214 [Paeniglutamicibacter cryotolerans]|uniref:Uncharacterized protein n=1 Tax=Paeniglutamicibacter cryotolerans TaxID=670079 RepID=A0A839QK97_9MICC|nr:hypothetical protein [Paeniglutamicibacter cryotolerans]
MTLRGSGAGSIGRPLRPAPPRPGPVPGRGGAVPIRPGHAAGARRASTPVP